MDAETVVARTNAPAGRRTETLNVGAAGPTESLRQTLDLLPDLSSDVVLVQYNDSVPRHLFPTLDDRGYATGPSRWTAGPRDPFDVRRATPDDWGLETVRT